MAVSFSHIPANLRLPLFHAEVDASQASYFVQDQRALLVGQRLAAGTAAADLPVLVSSSDQAGVLFGAGSVLSRMVAAYRRNDDFGAIWCLPVSDAGAAVAATGTVTLSGTATATGALSLYIAGQRVQIAVASGATAASAATALAAAITAAADLPVTAAADGGAVTLTAKNKGPLGNDIDLRLNFLGALGGEVTPAGLTAAVTAMADGATAPSLAAGLAALGDEPFDFIACPYTDTASLDALKGFMDDQSGRWAWSRQLYGHVFAARRGTVTGNIIDASASTYGVYSPGGAKVIVTGGRIVGGGVAKKGIFLNNGTGSGIAGVKLEGFVEDAIHFRASTATVTNISVIGGGIASSTNAVTTSTASGGTIGSGITVRGCSGITRGTAYDVDIIDVAADIIEGAIGATSPEGAVTAGPGSRLRGTDGRQWAKASGTGATGWRQIADTTSYTTVAVMGVAGGITAGNSDTLPWAYSCNASGAWSTATYGWGLTNRNTDGNFELVRRAGSTSNTVVMGVNRATGAVTWPNIGTTAAAANAVLDSGSSNSLLRSTSSILYKADVEDLYAAYADRILSLRPVWYRSLAAADRPDWSWYGLIAEEVAAVEPRLVQWAHPLRAEVSREMVVIGGTEAEPILEEQDVTRYVPDTSQPLQPDGVQYERLTVLLLSVVQRLERRVAELEAAK